MGIEIKALAWKQVSRPNQTEAWEEACFQGGINDECLHPFCGYDVAILANIAGYAWNLYGQIRLFDEVLHAYRTFALTLPIALFLYQVVLTGAHTHLLLFVLAAASLGLAIGAVWEIAEWGYDQIVPGNVILGRNDTIIDLMVDAVGSILAGLVSVGMTNKE